MNAVNLNQVWTNLTSTCEDKQLTQALWTEIEKEHTRKKRHYHNLHHLENMIQFAFQYQDQINHLETILFTIFYHDIVYHVTRKDNEEKSALVATDRLSKLNLDKEVISHIERQILETKYHRLQVEQDTNFLLDFDLAILGSDSDTYKLYTKNIREEYSIYPNFLYRKGRIKVLKHFLESDSIYKTSPFIEKYENQARLNLEKELTQLLNTVN